jgi:hypothetical protein
MSLMVPEMAVKKLLTSARLRFLAAVFLDEPADVIVAFAGAFGAFDAEHVELILDVAKHE